MDLQKTAREINDINRANGWNVIEPQDWDDGHIVPACIALIHSELSEALEDFRKDDLEHFKEEIADTMIRCLDLCGGLKINIEAEIRRKMRINCERTWRHGGKKL